ncbi:MAG: GAF domain-containing protein [Bacteroidetes bacterium]|nr:GAF domain-containing protein [Bacteroidota bacterium]MBU1116081.1 GAF domain-containing protein [Bacteroidota bacterium]MBU1799151.1 GAF domain-containing protein [Bacteroidota bacterium]
MDSASRNRKRILIFSIIPILAVVPFFTEDFILRLISSVMLIIYSAFIIFLRDSSRTDAHFDEAFSNESNNYDKTDYNSRKMEADEGEEFKIISPNKTIEVRKSSEFIGGITPQSSGRNFFKSPELKIEFDKIATEKIPDDISDDQLFGFALDKILLVVKDAFNAHSAIFFWYNPKSKKIALEKYASSTKDIIKQKFDVEDDVLSKIVVKKEPEIISDLALNAEKDNIRYYTSPQGIKSFVGVPLYYGKSLAGILTMDSKENDTFGIETIYSLGRFVRVISLLISLFEEKHADSQADKRLKSLLEILAIDKKFDDENELFSTIESSVKKLISWDIFTFVYYEPNEKQFKISKIINNTSLKYIGGNKNIDLANTLVGRAIVNGSPIKIDDTNIEKIPRFAKDEDISFGGAFLAIPLSYDGQIYGVFCFDSLKADVYSNADLSFIKKAIKIFSYIVYTFTSQKILKNLLSVDVETRLLNGKNFLKLSNSDLIKAKAASLSSTLAIIKIDKFIDDESLFEGNPFPKVLKLITTIIVEATSEQNIVGRISRDVFGVYFFNTDSKDVFLWAEKLRIKIARTPVLVSTKQTTYTVSIGIAAAHEKMDINALVENAELALNKAIEKGGNSVKNI